MGMSAPNGDWGTPDPTVGAGEMNGSRGWCQVTSRECTILPVSASMILKQSHKTVQSENLRLLKLEMLKMVLDIGSLSEAWRALAKIADECIRNRVWLCLVVRSCATQGVQGPGRVTIR